MPPRPARVPRVEVAVAVPVRSGRCLIARRGDDAHLAGTWEFPGGKIRAGEPPAEAARRELLEETGLSAPSLEPLGVFVHDYPDRRVRLHCFVAVEPEGEVRVDGRRSWAWVAREALDPAGMPAANAAILRALRSR